MVERGEGSVASAILLEGAGRSVDCGAVELDDDALATPEGVDLDEPIAQRQVRIEPRARKTGAVAQREKPLLEAAARDAGRRPREGGAQRRDPAAFRDAIHGVVDGTGIEEAQHLGLVHRPVERVRGEDAGEVDERPRDGRDRDATDDGGVRRGEDANAVHVDAGPASGTASHRADLVVRTIGRAHAPCGRRAAMAQDGALAAREHRGHPAPVGREQRVADGIDASVHAVQPTTRNAMRDPTGTQAQRPQLPRRHDAVLTCGELSQRNRAGFRTTCVHKAAHLARVPADVCQRHHQPVTDHA